MRLSVLTDEVSVDLEEALRFCTAEEISAVELRQIGDDNVVDMSAAGLRQVRAALDGGGFTCPAVASPFLKTERREVSWDVLERSIEAASALGAGIVRTFSWLRTDDPDEVVPDLSKVLVEAAARTERAGLQLALEVEHACNVATGAEARRLLDRIPEAAIGVIWDPGNEAMFGSRPYPEGYEAVRGRVVHVHLKDVDEDRIWTRIGAGIVDYRGQLRALAADGYQGHLSIETHFALAEGGRAAATRENVAALRQLAGELGIDLR